MIYPLVIIGQEIKNIIANPKECNYLGSLPQKPLEPVKPKRPQKENFEGDKGIDKTLAIIYFVIFSFIAFINRGTPQLILLIIVLAVISYFMTLSIIKGNPSKEYERALVNFELREKSYQESMERYKCQIDNYIRKRNNIDGFNKLVNNNATQRQLSKYLLTIYFSKSAEFSNESRVKKGASEQKFYNKLTNSFPGKIFQNKNFEMFGYSYHPDFIYYDESSRIHIDIEVDEPYSFEEKVPIHTLGSDDVRNKCFINNNWIVIRFAEEQVITQPVECCKIIENTIKYLNFELKEEISITEGVNIKQIEMWGIFEAEEMINENYREKYTTANLR